MDLRMEDSTLPAASNSIPRLISSSSSISPSIEEDEKMLPPLSPDDMDVREPPRDETREDEYTQMTSVMSPNVAAYVAANNFHADLLSGYALGGELGQGGFGFVLEGLRRQDSKPVAVKFIFRSRVPTQSWARDVDLGVIPLEVFVLKNVGTDKQKGKLRAFVAS